MNYPDATNVVSEVQLARYSSKYASGVWTSATTQGPHCNAGLHAPDASLHRLRCMVYRFRGPLVLADAIFRYRFLDPCKGDMQKAIAEALQVLGAADDEEEVMMQGVVCHETARRQVLLTLRKWVRSICDMLGMQAEEGPPFVMVDDEAFPNLLSCSRNDLQAWGIQLCRWIHQTFSRLFRTVHGLREYPYACARKQWRAGDPLHRGAIPLMLRSVR